MIQTLVIDNFHPTRLNQLLGNRFKRHRLKASDRDIVTGTAMQQGIIKATGKRRLIVRITLAPRQRAADVDAYQKSLCDALVCCGALLDDNRQSVELGPILFDRGPRKMTTILLEDL